ncbi:MAG: hypothetical protein PSV22_16280 [Pseudolabrys sp.]|nr:hypothetical protein [Pseudolabrys sp.]
MRKTIILGSILALIGVASVAQASDRLNTGERDASRVQSESSDGSGAGQHDRNAREETSRDRHNESRDRHDESRERHDEARERSDRR